MTQYRYISIIQRAIWLLTMIQDRPQRWSHEFFIDVKFFLDLMNIYGPFMACIISKSSSNFVPSNPTKQMEHSNGPQNKFRASFLKNVPIKTP